MVAAKKETGFLLSIQKLTVISNKKPGFWVLLQKLNHLRKLTYSIRNAIPVKIIQLSY